MFISEIREGIKETIKMKITRRGDYTYLENGSNKLIVNNVVLHQTCKFIFNYMKLQLKDNDAICCSPFSHCHLRRRRGVTSDSAFVSEWVWTNGDSWFLKESRQMKKVQIFDSIVVVLLSSSLFSKIAIALMDCLHVCFVDILYLAHAEFHQFLCLTGSRFHSLLCSYGYFLVWFKAKYKYWFAVFCRWFNLSLKATWWKKTWNILRYSKKNYQSSERCQKETQGTLPTDVSRELINGGFFSVRVWPNIWGWNDTLFHLNSH